MTQASWETVPSLSGKVIQRAVKTDGNVTAVSAVPGDDVAGLSITITPPLGTRYYLTFSATMLSASTTSTGAQLGIYEGATQKAAAKWNISGANNEGVPFYCETDVIVADGNAHTYNVKLARTTGAGNAVIETAATEPAILKAIYQ